MSEYVSRSVSLRYDLFIPGGVGPYSWHTGVEAGYEGRAETYFTPRSVFGYDNASAGLFVKKNLRVGKTCRLLVGADASYTINMGGEYDYNGPDPEHRVITVFYANEYAFHTADFVTAGFDATFTVPVRNAVGVNIGASFDGLFPTSGSWNRWTISGVLSVLF